MELNEANNFLLISPEPPKLSQSEVVTGQHHDPNVFRFARKRKLCTYHDVVDGDYLDVARYEHTRHSDSTLTFKTSCIAPDSCLQDLRVADSYVSMKPQPLIPRSIQKPHIRLLGGLTSFELVAVYEVEQGAVEVGIDLFHSSNGFTHTSVLYKPDQGLITIDRHAANRKKGIDAHAESSPLTLLLQHDKKNATIKRECLEMHIFYDDDLLEVFVNDRVAMRTQIQPDSGKCFGVNSWIGENGSAKMLRCELWELKLGGRELKL